MKPLLVANFKAYASGTGEEALLRAQRIAEVARAQSAVEVVVAAQAADLRLLAGCGVPVFAQHVDAAEPGAHTGHVTAEAVRAAGAAGAIVNHPEHRLAEAAAAVRRCKQLGLRTIACASTLSEAQGLVSAGPDAIAFEVPELIASGKGVSTHAPQAVQAFVAALEGSGVAPLCGAGVSTKEDCAAALRLGARGVLLASALLKPADPRPALRELLAGLRPQGI